MDIVRKYLPIVNHQISLQERLARKYEITPWRRDMHLQSAQQFKELADDLVVIQSRLNEVSENKTKHENVFRRMSLTLEDIEGLPDELMQELNISDSDKLEFTIVSIINSTGGISSLDKILVGLFKKTGDIHKRNILTSRLYRMAQKRLIFNVPNRKGFYSTDELSEQDAKRLFGQEEDGMADGA